MARDYLETYTQTDSPQTKSPTQSLGRQIGVTGLLVAAQLTCAYVLSTSAAAAEILAIPVFLCAASLCNLLAKAHSNYLSRSARVNAARTPHSRPAVGSATAAPS